MKQFNIRAINEDDITSINRIYNDAIKLGYSTAHNSPLAISFHKDWYEAHKKQKNPILVAVYRDKVVGWNALSHYREGRPALISVRETSYYVDQNYWNQGIASLLMRSIIEKAIEMDIKTLVTLIMSINETSLLLMEKFDFELWGRLPGILDTVHGKCDHLIFGRNI